jgi:hypothetical protein
MTDSTSIATQLSELAVEITGRVAEMLAYAARDMELGRKQKIYEMIEQSLPTVVLNTLLKTTALHSSGGIDHLKANVDHYAEQFAQRFIKNDM